LGSEGADWKDGYFGTGLLVGDGYDGEYVKIVNGLIQISEIATPQPPPTGTGVLYGKSDGYVYWQNSSGDEYNLTGGSGIGLGQVIHTSTNYSIALSNATVIADASSASVTITLPTASSANEYVFTIKKRDVSANSVVVDASGAEVIDGSTTYSLLTQYEAITVQSDGIQWWIIG
jgi:hypothetical protein